MLWNTTARGANPPAGTWNQSTNNWSREVKDTLRKMFPFLRIFLFEIPRWGAGDFNPGATSTFRSEGASPNPGALFLFFLLPVNGRRATVFGPFFCFCKFQRGGQIVRPDSFVPGWKDSFTIGGRGGGGLEINSPGPLDVEGPVKRAGPFLVSRKRVRFFDCRVWPGGAGGEHPANNRGEPRTQKRAVSRKRGPQEWAWAAAPVLSPVPLSPR